MFRSAPTTRPWALTLSSAPSSFSLSFLTQRLTLLLVFFLVCFLVCFLASPGYGQDFVACPVPFWLTSPPSAAHSPAPSSALFPLHHDPDSLRTAEGDLRIRYQQLIAVSTLSQPLTLTALRFRLDPATPLADLEGELSYAVDLRLGYGPAFPDQLSPWFDDNPRGDLETVFDGAVVVGAGRSPAHNPLETTYPGDTIEVVFEHPFAFDPAFGGLLIDLRMRGAFGQVTPFALDAAPTWIIEDPIDPILDLPADSASEVIVVDDPVFETGWLVTLDEDRFPAAQPLLGGPVVELQLLSGPVREDLPRRCLIGLEVPRPAAKRLWFILRRAQHWAERGKFHRASEALADYQQQVEELEQEGIIDPHTAEMLHRLGAEEAFAVGGADAFLDAIPGIDDMGLAQPPEIPFSVEDEGAAKLDPEAENEEFERILRRLDELMKELLIAELEGDADEGEILHAAIVELLRRVQRDAELREELGLQDEEVIEFLHEVELFIEDYDLLKSIAEASEKILEDNDLDRDDLESLHRLKSTFAKIREKLPDDGFVAFLIDTFALPPLTGLGTLIDSGDLQSVAWSGDANDGSVKIDIGDSFDIRTIELKDVDSQTWYGKTNLYLDVHFEKDMEISWTTTWDSKVGKITRLVVEPEEALLLDLDSSGIWVVHYIEGLVGIPDLDDFFLAEIVTIEDTTIVRGTSNGAKVVIKVKGDRATVTVDGKKTYPN